ncbi:hypothetical protein LINGRAHAP2_LOCUS26761 [Linum grandiflorum]
MLLQIGVIMLNTDGGVVDGRAGRFVCRAPICAEAAAVLHAISLAMRSSRPAVILTDCQVLTTAICNPPHRWSWECAALVATIVQHLSLSP